MAWARRKKTSSDQPQFPPPLSPNKKVKMKEEADEEAKEELLTSLDHPPPPPPRRRRRCVGSKHWWWCSVCVGRTFIGCSTRLSAKRFNRPIQNRAYLSQSCHAGRGSCFLSRFAKACPSQVASSYYIKPVSHNVFVCVCFCLAYVCSTLNDGFSETQRQQQCILVAALLTYRQPSVPDTTRGCPSGDE